MSRTCTTTNPRAGSPSASSRTSAPGKVFFSNSGGEANEGLFKLARKFGHDEGRFEILTAHNSFHGRTLAGIAATGQDKVKKGFEPMVAGFRHVPFNDLEADPRRPLARHRGHPHRRHPGRRRHHPRHPGVPPRAAPTLR